MFRRLLWHSFRALNSYTQWGRRRFSHAGLFILVLVIFSGLFGVNTRGAMSYQLFALLFTLLLLAIGSHFFRRIHITTDFKLPRYGTVHQTIHYRAQVVNPLKRPLAGLSIIEDITDPRPDFADYRDKREPDYQKINLFDRFIAYPRWQWLIKQNSLAPPTEQAIPTLPPQTMQEIKLQIYPQRRGLLTIKGLSVFKPDPFGLTRAISKNRQPQTITILPKRFDLPPLELPGKRKHHSGGTTSAGTMGDTNEFVSLREFRPGDPLRHIHWKGWAHRGTPIIKEFQAEYFSRHALILDTCLHNNQTAVFEDAISLAASFIARIDTRESLLDLMFAGDKTYTYTTGHGAHDNITLLEVLAVIKAAEIDTTHINTHSNDPFDALLTELKQNLGQINGCICILQNWDEKRQALLACLNAHNIPFHAYLITEPNAQINIAQPFKTQLKQLEQGRIEQGMQES